jgi:ribosomal protein S24E
MVRILEIKKVIKMVVKYYYAILSEGENVVKIDLKNKIGITDRKARVKLYSSRKEAEEIFKKYYWPIWAVGFYAIKKVKV